MADVGVNRGPGNDRLVTNTRAKLNSIAKLGIVYDSHSGCSPTDFELNSYLRCLVSEIA